MPSPLVMPQLGESMAEGTITRWLKQEGDTVEADEPLCEIATDKVNAELPSPVAGTLQKILVPEGTVAPVGAQLALVADPAELNRPSSPPLATQESHWGSDSPHAPRGAAIDGRVARAAASEAAEPRKRTTLLVRRLAAENGVDLDQVEGTGANGRVTRQDILNFLAHRGAAAAPAAATAAPPAAPAPTAPAPAPAAAARPAPPAQPTTLPPPAGRSEAVTLTPMRRAIADHMVRSVLTSPHATTIFEVDMTNVMRWRDRVKDRFRQREGVSLTYLPIVIQAAVSGLRAWPVVNSSWGGDRVYLRQDINIGIAVGLDEGLVVPVIHQADEKNLVGLAKAIDSLARRAREGKLGYQDLEGGTFTVNNTGAYGSLLSIPIINQPQAAILAMEAIVRRPVADEMGNLAVRPMMYIVLSYDHRMIDGLTAGRYLAHLKKWLEEFQGPPDY